MKQFILLLLTAVMLVACQNVDNQNEPNNDPAKDKETNDQMMDDDRNTSDGMTDNNQTMAEYQMIDDAKLKTNVEKEIEGVNNVYLMQMGQTVYVAADVENDTMPIDETEKAISQVIKDTYPEVETVRLTTNPDFLDLADRYQKEVNAGRPVEGFFNEIGEMIDRVFPDRAE